MTFLEKIASAQRNKWLKWYDDLPIWERRLRSIGGVVLTSLADLFLRLDAACSNRSLTIVNETAYVMYKLMAETLEASWEDSASVQEAGDLDLVQGLQGRTTQIYTQDVKQELANLLPLTIRAIAADTLAELFSSLADIDPVVAEAATKLAKEYKQRLERAKADDHV